MLASIIFLSSSVFAANRYVNMTLTYDYQKHKYNAEEVFVAIDGTRLTNLTMPPIILNNYTLVPAREVFEKLGAKVEWKKDIEQVYITYGKTLIVIPINSEKAYVNGVVQKMDTKAKIINNKTMIPLRFVTTASGLNIEWDSKTRVANVVTGGQAATTTKTEPTTQPTTKTPATTTTKAVVTTEKSTAQTTTKPTSQNMSNLITGNGNVRFENEVLYIKASGVNISDIIHNDDYINKVYTLTVKGDLRGTISDTTLTPNSDRIKGCSITAGANSTTIKFTENRINAFDIFNSDGYLCIKAVSPKEIYDKIVILDPGHGGTAIGATGNNLVEKDLIWAMASDVKKRLDAQGNIKCYMTRTGDYDVSLEARAAMANDIGGDMFVSIHINSTESAEPNGTETYALYPNDLGNGMTSYAVAEEMLNQLLEKLGTNNRKVKSNTYVVLKQNKIPATLLEIGFISNPQEAEMMNNSAGKVGEAVVEGINNLFSKYPTVR